MRSLLGGLESKLVLGGGGQNVEDRTFFSINTKARDVGEGINGLGEESDSLEGFVGQNSVVGERPDDGSSNGRSLGKEGAVSQNKEKGGEGAALLHTSVNGDGDLNPARENGANTGFQHQPANDVDDPAGHVDLFQNSKEVVVIDAVKGLSCVNEQKVVLLLFVELVVVSVGELLVRTRHWSSEFLMRVSKASRASVMSSGGVQRTM